MTERTPKVGDVVAWADVPRDFTLVRRSVDDGAMYYLRLGSEGWCVGKVRRDDEQHWEAVPDNPWLWKYGRHRGEATIVALNLTGQETAAELQRLAEVFEVREAEKSGPR